MIVFFSKTADGELFLSLRTHIGANPFFNVTRWGQSAAWHEVRLVWMSKASGYEARMRVSW